VRAAGGEELKNLLIALDARPAPGGHRVVLRANRLFARGGAKLTPQSEELKLLVLDLVKALPGHRVELNGYVSSGKSAAQRTRLASARAWAFYSYLVKSGVDAARLDVNGRAAPARSPDRLELLFKKAAAE
ncbi:MAG: OmpA family protein, partial [Elusimicrobiota bacterium]